MLVDCLFRPKIRPYVGGPRVISLLFAGFRVCGGDLEAQVFANQDHTKPAKVGLDQCNVGEVWIVPSRGSGELSTTIDTDRSAVFLTS